MSDHDSNTGLLNSSHKSPAITPIKVLAPLHSLAPQSNSTNSNSSAAVDSKESAASNVPAPLFLDTDEPDAVALAKGEHLLNQRWCYWFDVSDSSGGTKKDWGASLKKLIEFNSIEQFWGTVNNIARPSVLPMKSDYHLFQYGVKPEWEDPQNRSGGKWLLEMRKGDEGEMDRYWLHTLLAMIGESFSDGNHVLGAVISLRKGRNRIALWTRTDEKKVCERIGHEWKKFLGLSANIKIGFTSHASVMNRSYGDVSNQYTV